MDKNKAEIVNYLTSVIADLLEMNIKDIKLDCDLSLYGLDSILAMKLINLLDSDLNIQLEPSIILEYPTISALSSFLYQNNCVLNNNG